MLEPVDQSQDMAAEEVPAKMRSPHGGVLRDIGRVTAALRFADPFDDAGAETLDRFEWQVMVASRDLLGMYLDALRSSEDPAEVDDVGLVCEYHEDYATIHPAGSEIVSCKHKEPEFGSFTTTTKLFDSGGLWHLFRSWHSLGGTIRCRLVTTAGLDAKVQGVQRLCRHFSEVGGNADLPDDRGLAELFGRMQEALQVRALSEPTNRSAPVEGLLSHWLACLTVETGLPARQHMTAVGKTDYAGPVAAAVHRPELGPEIWHVTVDLVRQRMRAAAPTPHGQLPSALPEAADPLVSRTLTVADLDVAVNTVISSPAGFTPLHKPSVINRLTVKMAEGRCAPTSIERAEFLRRRYRRWQRGLRAEIGGAAEDADLQQVMLRIADHAIAENPTQHPRGAALWRALEAKLAVEAGMGRAEGVDADMLLGGIADLTNRCKVWFSDGFDVEERIARMRAGDSR